MVKGSETKKLCFPRLVSVNFCQYGDSEIRHPVFVIDNRSVLIKRAL